MISLENPSQENQDSVHVHALWRTGSTQWWSIMREIPSFRTYYEPFHENIIDRTHERCRESHESKPKHDIFRHPQVAEHYFAEFPLSESGGLSLFRSRFTLDDFARTAGEEDPEMSAYVQSLIDFAEEKEQTPAFQYNRSILRAAWLQQEFGGQHIYLVRNPAGIYQSASSFTASEADKRGPGNYFLTCPVMVIGKNTNHPHFSDIARLYNIEPYEAATFKDEITHYASVAEGLSEQAHRDITALFWTIGICHAVEYADLIVDVDALTSDDYRDGIEAQFDTLTGQPMSLSSYRQLSGREQSIEVSDEARQIIAEQARNIGVDLAKVEEAITNEASLKTAQKLLLDT